MNLKEKLEKLTKEKKSLADCPRKRQLEIEIKELTKQMDESSNEPTILVKHSGKVIGNLDYNQNESSWWFKANDGSKLEIGFSYDEVRSWASINRHQIKVVKI